MENKNKSVKSVKRGVGRPRAVLAKIPQGRFDVKKAAALNPDLSLVAVYKCIKRLLSAGKLSKLRERKEHNGPGRPGWVFVRKAVAKKAPAKVPSVNLTAPAPVEAPAPEPVTA
jgi:hypothetical protein